MLSNFFFRELVAIEFTVFWKEFIWLLLIKLDVILRKRLATSETPRIIEKFGDLQFMFTVIR